MLTTDEVASAFARRRPRHHLRRQPARLRGRRRGVRRHQHHRGARRREGAARAVHGRPEGDQRAPPRVRRPARRRRVDRLRARRAVEGQGDGRREGRRRRRADGARRRDPTSCASRRRSSSRSTRSSKAWRGSRRRSTARWRRSRPRAAAPDGLRPRSRSRAATPRRRPSLNARMFFVRPIARDDLPAVLALSERTGTGLTTLPANRERLAARIERSLASFAGTAARADACYVFVLVDGARSGDRVVGISAIEAAVGLAEPWYNYPRRHARARVARARRLHGRADAVPRQRPHRPHRAVLAVPRPGATGTARTAPLLAKCRLLFIAEFAERFAPKVIAELRGRLDADGRSPFWEGLGRHFFAMEYSTADYLTGHRPEVVHRRADAAHPVYVNLLPEAARDAIGDVHADTAPARAMLEQEGFRYEGYVDIFDAGPTLECFRDDIHAVRAVAGAAGARWARRTRCPTASPTTSCGSSPTARFADFRAIVVARAGARSTAFRCCRYAAQHARRRRRRHRARGAARRRGTGTEMPMTLSQLRRHSRARRTTTRASRAATSRPSATRSTSPIRARRRCRDSPRCARSPHAAIAQAVLPPHERPARRRRCARSASPAATRDGARARRARSAGAARRVLVGGGDVGRQRRDGQPVGRHRRRPRAFHARQPRRALPPLARGADDDARAARDLRRRDALRRPRSAACGAAARRRGCGQSHALRQRRRRRRRRVLRLRPRARSTRRRPRRAISRRGRRARHRQAIARRHGLDPARACSRSRHPDAIDAGVFHNDVIAVGHGTVLFCHERAFVDQHAVLADAGARASGRRSRRSSCRRAEVTLDDAVATYLFNSQLLPRADGRLLLVAPAECRENAARRRVSRRARRAAAVRSPRCSRSTCGRACATAADRRACACASR